MRSRVKLNIVANVAGTIWTLIMSIAFVPLYIAFLGVEAYGIIAFYASLLIVVTTLDFGLTATISREAAWRSAIPEEHGSLRDITRTLELVYWIIGATLGALLIIAAPSVAANWLNVSELPVGEVTGAIVLIGVALAIQWPTSIYAGGLGGLQYQVDVNAIQIATATARGVGAIAVLSFVSPTLDAFFTWQVLVNLFGLLITRHRLWRRMPKVSANPRFDFTLIFGIWRFAAGMTGISLTGVMLSQADKIILSAVLPLTSYGYYMLAAALAAACGMLAGPISRASYPHLTQLVATGSAALLRSSYHKACSLVAIAVLPLATVVSVFAFDVVYFWIQDVSIATQVAPIARLLAIGTALNSLALLPYLLQLAHGVTRITLVANGVMAAVLVPAVYFLAEAYGATGAAAAWPLLNFLYVVVLVPVVHRRFLPGATTRFFLLDIGPVAAASVLIATTAKLLQPGGLSGFAGFAFAGATGAVALTTAAVSSPSGRIAAVALWRQMQRTHQRTTAN